MATRDEIDMKLRAHVKSHCAPIWWEQGRQGCRQQSARLNRRAAPKFSAGGRELASIHLPVVGKDACAAAGIVGAR